MAVPWAGFSEEDLELIRKGNYADTTQQIATKQALLGKGKCTTKLERKSSLTKQVLEQEVEEEPLPAAAKLSDPGPTCPTSPSRTVKLKIVDGSFEILNGGKEDAEDASTMSSASSRSDVNLTSQSSEDTKSPDDDDPERRKVYCKLEEFRARQKYMEEQNRLKKELVLKALTDRKKQTQAETKKLHYIQDELQKLDNSLSNDVSILRDQIETASLEFSEAQKRYDRAEKEFVEAKLNMYGKLERKELLTEHLCTIIEQNELRKAKKLSDLMERLEMIDNEPIVLESEPVLTQLALTDDIGYVASTTLKAPVSSSLFGTSKVGTCHKQHKSLSQGSCTIGSSHVDVTTDASSGVTDSAPEINVDEKHSNGFV